MTEAGSERPEPGEPHEVAPDVVEELARRVADAEYRATDAKFRLDRLRGRRGVKVALTLARGLSNLPGSFRHLGGLRKVLVKTAPAPPPKRNEAEDVLRGLHIRGRGWSRTQPPVYPHLRAAAIGSPRFTELVTVEAVDLGYADWYLSHRADLLLVDGSTRDPRAAGMARTARAAGISVVVDATGMPVATPELIESATVVVSTDPMPDVDPAHFLRLPPSVSPAQYNPIGISSSAIPIHMGESRPLDLESCLAAAAEGALVLADGLASLGVPSLLDVAAAAMVLDPIEVERRSVSGRRAVLRDHSNRERFERLLERLQIPILKRKTISMLLCTNRPDRVVSALAGIAGQTYPERELVLVLHGDGFDQLLIEDATARLGVRSRIVSVGQLASFGDALNEGIDAVSGPLVTKIDDDDWYGPEHLYDLALAIEYSGADVVGKWSNFAYLAALNRTVSYHPERQEVWADHLPGATLLLNTEVLRSLRFARLGAGVDSDLLARIRDAGGRLYSTHRFGFVRHRHGHHTYVQSDRHFIERAGKNIWDGLRTDLAFV